MWSLEINDILLRLEQNGTNCYEGPGLAYVTDDTTMFSEEALSQLFVHPVQCQTSFWQRMSEDAIDQRSNSISKYSDLVYNQLSEIFKTSAFDASDSGWVVVPSDLDSDQVGLLYGILDYTGVKPRGFVDAALVASSKAEFANDLYYVDMHLQRTVITHLKREQDQLEVASSKTISAAGYLQLVKRWIDAVAERSLDETRFDPRVVGTTEQQVFDRLRERLEAVELIVSVEHNGETRSTSMLRDELASSSIDIFDRILSECEHDAPVMLGQHAMRMPGLLDFVEKSGHAAITSQSDSAAQALARLNETIPQDADVELHRSLTFDAQATETVSAAKEPPISIDPAADAPTHLLIGHVAHPIGSKRDLSIDEDVVCTLSLENGHMQLHVNPGDTVTVNRQRIHGQTLVQGGDLIAFGKGAQETKEIVLINVVNSG